MTAALKRFDMASRLADRPTDVVLSSHPDPMQGPFGGAVAVVLVILGGCGGKIAAEGSSSSSGEAANSSSGSTGSLSDAKLEDPFFAPAPSGPGSSLGDRPAPTCPLSLPEDGDPCSWRYNLPCDYAVRKGDVCSQRCTCFVGSRLESNHWTCFDVPCEP
jgi:hypothetical protein